MADLSDFDRYCEDHDVQPRQYDVAFAQWLANLAGRPITGERVDGHGSRFTAEPDPKESGEHAKPI